MNTLSEFTCPELDEVLRLVDAAEAARGKARRFGAAAERARTAAAAAEEKFRGSLDDKSGKALLTARREAEEQEALAALVSPDEVFDQTIDTQTFWMQLHRVFDYRRKLVDEILGQARELLVEMAARVIRLGNRVTQEDINLETDQRSWASNLGYVLHENLVRANATKFRAEWTARGHTDPQPPEVEVGHNQWLDRAKQPLPQHAETRVLERWAARKAEIKG